MFFTLIAFIGACPCYGHLPGADLICAHARASHIFAAAVSNGSAAPVALFNACFDAWLLCAAPSVCAHPLDASPHASPNLRV